MIAQNQIERVSNPFWVAAEPERLSYAASNQKKVETQFAAMLWKSILKQALPSPNLSFGSEQSSIASGYANDLYHEQLAMQLAQSQAFSARQFFPPMKGSSK